METKKKKNRQNTSKHVVISNITQQFEVRKSLNTKSRCLDDTNKNREILVENIRNSLHVLRERGNSSIIPRCPKGNDWEMDEGNLSSQTSSDKSNKRSEKKNRRDSRRWYDCLRKTIEVSNR